MLALFLGRREYMNLTDDNSGLESIFAVTITVSCKGCSRYDVEIEFEWRQADQS